MLHRRRCRRTSLPIHRRPASIEAILILGYRPEPRPFHLANGTTKFRSLQREIELGDDTDVGKLYPRRVAEDQDGGWFGGRTVEFRADGSGDIQRRFWAGASEKPFEPEGRQWLAQALPKFIRQTGIGAPRRVARILKAKGPSGVLAEISLIEGSWAKRTYFGELFKTATLDAAMVRPRSHRQGKRSIRISSWRLY